MSYQFIGSLWLLKLSGDSWVPSHLLAPSKEVEKLQLGGSILPGSLECSYLFQNQISWLNIILSKDNGCEALARMELCNTRTSLAERESVWLLQKAVLPHWPPSLRVSPVDPVKCYIPQQVLFEMIWTLLGAYKPVCWKCPEEEVT